MGVATAIPKFAFKIAGAIFGGCVGAAIFFALAFASGYFIGTIALLLIYAALPIGGLLGAINGYHFSSTIWSSASDSFTLWKYWFFPPVQSDDDEV